MHHQNPANVQFDGDELRRVRRVLYARWLGISPAEWDAMTYAEQCDVIEIKRAFEENTRYDRAMRQ